MKYIINGACKSVIGNVRENNEDNYYFDFKTLKEDNEGNNKIKITQFENTDNVVCSVFDGMGGEAKGERASYLASSTLKQYIQENTNSKLIWEEYIETANEKICKEMLPNQRMGTTMAAVQFLENSINICNIGDSRIYGFKNKKLEQLSEDHTDAKIQEKLNINNTRTKARLTQHLGIRKNEMILNPYKNKYDYTKFEKILLCTDGLTDMLTDKEIEHIMSKKLDSKDIVDALVEKALEKGGTDNITVIVLEIKEEKRQFYKMILPIIVTIMIVFIVIAIMMRNNRFEVIKNEYSGSIMAGQSFGFEYKGNANVDFSNEKVEYKDGKITAKEEGTTVMTITDNNENVLFQQTIKIFPNQE